LSRQLADQHDRRLAAEFDIDKGHMRRVSSGPRQDLIDLLQLLEPIVAGDWDEGSFDLTAHLLPWTDHQNAHCLAWDERGHGLLRSSAEYQTNT
jgi:hypothetical protein